MGPIRSGGAATVDPIQAPHRQSQVSDEMTPLVSSRPPNRNSESSFTFSATSTSVRLEGPAPCSRVQFAPSKAQVSSNAADLPSPPPNRTRRPPAKPMPARDRASGAVAVSTLVQLLPSQHQVSAR